MFSFSSDEPASLFTLKRNLDENVLHFVLNQNSGGLNKKKPIKQFWILAGGNKKKELNSIQKNLVYGIKYTAKTEDYYKFHLHAYKHHLYLKKSSSGKYHVLTQFDNKFVIVQQIYIQIEQLGTMTRLPKIGYVDIYWYSPKNKKSGVTRVDVHRK